MEQILYDFKYERVHPRPCCWALNTIQCSLNSCFNQLECSIPMVPGIKKWYHKVFWFPNLLHSSPSLKILPVLPKLSQIPHWVFQLTYQCGLKFWHLFILRFI
ncbi:hypothetical protein CHS0354_041221 [Potamilus streckersoni]|uniref:Uncharacterized protein n=1 Tax=Potamilus streckersoni TaxID=2493646 RepID=A0AAE0SDN7_9BIVA|nr:hypothetical protein CHS0354_041221 [Potamilus streckersoni]